MQAKLSDEAGLARLANGHEQLMQRLAGQIDDDMLEEIAVADYGMDRAEHLAALQVIRAQGVPPGRMQWEPKEVLELFRWSHYGDNRTGQRSRSEREFHLMRAFCCTALLTAMLDPAGKGYFDGQNQTLAQLIDSLEMLGAPCEEEAVAFIAWVVQLLPEHEDEAAFFVLGLVWLMLRASMAGREQPLTAALLDWMLALEQEVRDVWQRGVGSKSDRWLLGTTFFNLKFDRWEALGERLAEVKADGLAPDLHARLQAIGFRLFGVD